MDEEMRKRLEEAAEKYINNHNNYLCSAFLKDRLKEAHIAGAEHGYKEAITQAKEWLKEHFHDIPQPDPDLINLHPVDVEADYWSMESMLADFEADMNKLWEGKKFTATIPPTIAWKLKEKGMSIMTEGHSIWCPMYADVFDWLMEKGIHIRIESDWDTETQIVTKLACGFHIEKIGMRPFYVDCPTWHEAANAAIEKALTLI